MAVRRRIDLLSGSAFFSQGLPLYVNRAVESYELHEHRHDFLEISYVSEGSGTHLVGDNSFPAVRGAVFWLPVGLSHVFRPALKAGGTLVVYNCVISMDALTGLLHSFPGGITLLPLLEVDQCLHYQDQHGEAERLFQQLHYEYEAERAGREAALYAHVIQLLLFIFRLHTEPEPEETPSSLRLGEVLHELHTRFQEKISVEEIARRMGVGPRQFHRIFRKQTGMNMSEYVQNVRITEACRLLRTGDGRIGDIATAVGYQDMSYFHALFKKKTGVTPQVYRQQNKK
ncbi:helix-turn-helix domain-containing protein [Paenibacillus medicaginis]|uniref:Helix-turn-helix domain-containing protein n=1 Tax=Paenibacillus medicaginis TaxID=1470560 RepID=A0ABV5BZX1_9BACL